MFSMTSQSSLSSVALATVFLLGCVALALPVTESASKHELNNLMSLLGKLKDTQRVRHSSMEAASSGHHRGKDVQPKDAAMLLSRDEDGLDSSYDFENDDDDDDSSSLSMAKRQGAWSFDYGLGGGRFGKRGGYAYPEYGLGGGRFGRDVDHVDPNHDAGAAL